MAIGNDPSKASAIDVGWTISNTVGAVKYAAKSTSLAVTDTTAIGTDNSSEFSVKGSELVGAIFDIVDSEDADVKCAWQWYDPKGEGFDSSGNPTSGTWTDIGTSAQDYASTTLDPSVSADNDAILRASKLRVQVVSTASTADESEHLNIVDAATVLLSKDNSAENNDTISNPITFGGIGADPS